MKKTNLSESIRVKLQESEKSVSDLAKFIESSVNDLQTTSYTNCRYILDDLLAVYVGWSDGYGEELRDDVIQHKESPSWAICAAVKVRNDADWADFDYLDQPWYEDGEVWDSSVSIVPNEDYEGTADWLLKNYEGIVKAHDNGEVFYTSEEEEEANEYNDDDKMPWERY